jgi:hypothetical protein
MAYMRPGALAHKFSTGNIQLCRDNKYKTGNRTFYLRDCSYHKEDPSILVKWMRRNFGERHQGWDFSLVGGCVTIELWDDRLITMYEMWQM